MNAKTKRKKAVEKLIRDLDGKISEDEIKMLRELIDDSQSKDENCCDNVCITGCGAGNVIVNGCRCVCSATRGNGVVTEKQYDLSKVSSLSIEGPWEAKLDSSAETDVCVVSMEENLLKYASVKCTGRRLRIALSGNIEPTKPLQVKILLKNMPSKLTQTGACSLDTGDLTGESFECDISGSSRLSMEKCRIDASCFHISGSSHVSGKITGKKADFRITGASEVNVCGKFDVFGADISGASDTDFDGTFKKAGIKVSGASRVKLAKAGECAIIVSGASDLRVHASKSLEGSVSGASNVGYSGVKHHDVRTSGASDIYLE